MVTMNDAGSPQLCALIETGVVEGDGDTWVLDVLPPVVDKVAPWDDGVVGDELEPGPCDEAPDVAALEPVADEVLPELSVLLEGPLPVPVVLPLESPPVGAVGPLVGLDPVVGPAVGPADVAGVVDPVFGADVGGPDEEVDGGYPDPGSRLPAGVVQRADGLRAVRNAASPLESGTSTDAVNEPVPSVRQEPSVAASAAGSA